MVQTLTERTARCADQGQERRLPLVRTPGVQGLWRRWRAVGDAGRALASPTMRTRLPVCYRPGRCGLARRASAVGFDPDPRLELATPPSASVIRARYHRPGRYGAGAGARSVIRARYHRPGRYGAGAGARPGPAQAQPRPSPGPAQAQPRPSPGPAPRPRRAEARPGSPSISPRSGSQWTGRAERVPRFDDSVAGR